MADAQYASIVGIVQQFPNQDVVTEREVNEQTVREFTVKSATSGKLVRISLWPEFADIEIEKGTSIIADGKFNVRKGKNGQDLYGLTPTTLGIVPPVAKAQREGTPTTDTQAAPF